MNYVRHGQAGPARFRRLVARMGEGSFWPHSLPVIHEGWGWLFLALAFANVMAFVVSFSNPIVSSDAWYFVDVFVKKALNGSLELSDFFARRGGLDHAQPLRKLMLLWELRYFHLDFRVEAILGTLAALACLLFVKQFIYSPSDRPHANRALLWCASIAAVLSLNSTGVWTWPLVSSAYTSYALLFLLTAALWNTLSTGRLVALWIAALALDLAADDTAIIVTLACWITLTIVAIRSDSMRYKALRAVGVLLLSLVAVRTLIQWLYPAPAEFAAAARFMPALLAEFAHGGWWQWITVPLASSVAFKLPLNMISGGRADTIQVALGVGLALAHAWFWYRAFRNEINAPTIAGMVVMLFFYGLLAGILYGRVSQFGNAYLHQPRYVMIYGFNLVALVLMSAGDTAQPERREKAKGLLVSALCVLLVAWQIPLSDKAWSYASYEWAYQARQSSQLRYIGEHHALPPQGCVPLLTVCSYPEAKREELVQLLKSHQLNVFSPAFRRANNLTDPVGP